MEKNRYLKTSKWMIILLYISDNPQKIQNKIRRATHTSSQLISVILKDLEKGGLIKYQKKGKTKVYEITNKGSEVSTLIHRINEKLSA